MDGRTGIIFNENGRVPTAKEGGRRYETILYAFYNKDIVVDDSNMETALTDCYKLVTIAKYLGCTSLVGKSIEVALLKHGQSFFRSIASVPHLWGSLAYSIRSELIFREAFIHLVGSWKNVKNNSAMMSYLRSIPNVRGFIEKYHRALLQRVKKLELTLMSEYPGDIATPTKDIPIKREEYSKDVLVHLALMFFRHWLGNRIISEQGRQADDCGYRLYRLIYAAGDAYMDKGVMNNFHTKFPMTKKAFTVLENHLSEIKEVMKDYVAKSKMVESTLQLDLVKFPVDYFTCTDLKHEDFPWLKEDKKAREKPAKRAYKPGGNEIARQNLESAKRFQSQERGLIGEHEEDVDEDGFEVDVEDDVMGSSSKRARAD